MPDDAMRRGGRGPKAKDIIRFRAGVFAQGRPAVCVTIADPPRVRVGYCWRDEEGIHLNFDNPGYAPEHYSHSEARIVGLVEDYFAHAHIPPGWRHGVRRHEADADEKKTA
jgi:hypothetical protein